MQRHNSLQMLRWLFFIEVHMDDLHGIRQRPTLDLVQTNFSQKDRFKIWTGHFKRQRVLHDDRQLRQQRHVRDAQGRSAGLLLTLNIPPCPPPPKKKEKASVKISTLLKVKTRITWWAAVSYCAVRLFGRPDQPTVSTRSRSEERVVRDIMNSS